MHKASAACQALTQGSSFDAQESGEGTWLFAWVERMRKQAQDIPIPSPSPQLPRGKSSCFPPKILSLQLCSLQKHLPPQKEGRTEKSHPRPASQTESTFFTSSLHYIPRDTLVFFSTKVCFAFFVFKVSWL